MNIKPLTILAFLSALALSANANELQKEIGDDSEFSAEPLSENDMGNVSLDAGINILNVYGASEAGLTVDSDESEGTQHAANDRDQSEDHTKEAATEEIKKLDQRPNNSVIVSLDGTPSEGELQNAIDESEVKVGNAEVFTTTSQIQYKKNNFKHNMTPSNDGTVTISRDLHVELLKLENLSGDHHDRSRSAGDIYLSDWRSRGDTTITPR